ncbi:ion channel [Sedimentitalea sp. XS_ASV28]|uniref:ion channel n=1 Tax=Sedimentitalea sp. XS_ASV28 TaxID=3241296 RepID=UPI003513D312
MTILQQIFWGSAILGFCLLIHVGCLALCEQALETISRRIRRRTPSMRITVMLVFALCVLIFALTIEVWIWSTIWIVFEIFPSWNEAVYFSLVTFTTVGYGDVVLGPEARILGSFAAVTGLLSFGLSTAFLIAVTNRLLAIEHLDHGR